MSDDLAGHPRLERMLAAVLCYGTWLASGVMALGLALALAGWSAQLHGLPILSSMNILAAGIALLILLPVFRVVLMAIVFLLERDYRYAAIAALVLIIIALGFITAALD